MPLRLLPRLLARLGAQELPDGSFEYAHAREVEVMRLLRHYRIRIVERTYWLGGRQVPASALPVVDT
jgi:hypothetical protein